MPHSPPDNAITISGLNKTYGGTKGGAPKHALNDISFDIPRGSFFGLLGPNGAGKSTLINILAGLVVKSSGEARVWGYDIEDDMRAARRSIGVVPQELIIDPFFTPREALDLQAGMYGVPSRDRRTDEILDAVGLSEQADTYARRLSGGMRRRLLVAKAMVHSPPVLVLDEPTAGVDVELRRQLWEFVKRLNREGTTVLLTTHYLEEAQELCDRIAIINHGRLIACDDKQNLLDRLDAKELTITVDADMDRIPDALQGFHVEQLGPRKLKFCYPPSSVNSGEILAALATTGLAVHDLVTKEAELQDIFLQLTSGSETG